MLPLPCLNVSIAKIRSAELLITGKTGLTGEILNGAVSFSVSDTALA